MQWLAASRLRRTQRSAHMRAGTLWIACFVVALSTLCTVAGACPTDLNVMPIADVVPHGHVNLRIEAMGTTSPLVGDLSWSLLSVFGVAQAVEVGLDLDDLGGETRLLLDAKWQFIEEGDRRPAVAVGLLNINRSADRAAYLVGARSFADDAVRPHAGAIHDGSSLAAMLGAEVEIASGITLILDWITGAHGATGFGVSSTAGESCELVLFVVEGHSGDEDTMIGVNLCWQAPW